MTCLRRLLRVTWRDKVPNTMVLKRTNSRSLENMLYQSQLRWLGHVIRMKDDRLPKQLLYGELSLGSRAVGAPAKRFRDSALKTLKDCQIKPQDLERLATDRDTWRKTTYHGLQLHESRRLDTLSHRRNRRKVPPLPSATNPTITCPECGRLCLSPIGLISHRKTHRRK